MIIANRVGGEVGIGSDDNEVTIISDAVNLTLPPSTKRKLARQIIAIISKEYKKR